MEEEEREKRDERKVKTGTQEKGDTQRERVNEGLEKK